LAQYVKAPVNAGVQFDTKQFSDFIESNGVLLEHFVCLPCPIGRIDRDDTLRRPHDDHSGCFNGFFFLPKGKIKAAIQGNNQGMNWVEQGLIEANPLHATLNTHYEKETATDTLEPVLVTMFDRFFLAEKSILVPHWEMMQYSGNGIDFTKHPIEEVEVLVDSTGKQYHNCEDFEIVKGAIKWGQNAPGTDPTTGKGLVYSIRYRYRPYYIVNGLPHEVRVIAQKNVVTGVENIYQSHQQVLLYRENVSRNADNDTQSKAPANKKEVSPRKYDTDLGDR
jgi:hypothetical protein